MAEQQILNRNYKIEGGLALITDIVQTALNKTELQEYKNNLVCRKAHLESQAAELQKQIRILDETLKEIGSLISNFDLLGGGGGGQHGDKQVL